MPASQSPLSVCSRAVPTSDTKVTMSVSIRGLVSPYFPVSILGKCLVKGIAVDVNPGFGGG